MINLDEGVSIVLKPLNGVSITVRVNGVAKESIFKWDRSDFFQRLYVLRVTGGVKAPQEGGDYDYDIDYKTLLDALKRLREAEAEFGEAKEEYNDTRDELNVTKTERKDTKKALKKAGRETSILQTAERKVNRAGKAKQEKQERKKNTEELEQQNQEKAQKRQKRKDNANDQLDGLGL